MSSEEIRRPRDVVDQVLGVRQRKQLWGAGYDPVLPVTPQDFTLGAVLPMVLYIMRWGFRRGVGQFVDTFGKGASVGKVSEVLSQRSVFEGFTSETHRMILADLLLAFCLENRNHRTGREEQVQRVFPTHYFSSWIDLPDKSNSLRRVPELIVSVLANQPHGSEIKPGCKGYYTLRRGFQQNLLLDLFGSGCGIRDDGNAVQLENFRSDYYDESFSVGVDQLLTIRLAQALGEAPAKLKKDIPTVSNQRPVALHATDHFYEDLNILLRAYGKVMPRQALLPILESSIAIGLTTVFLSTLRLVIEWEKTGAVVSKQQQQPWPLLVDCSSSTDHKLRFASEESFDDFLRRLNRLPISLVCMRIINQWAVDEKLCPPAPEPDPVEHINFLGSLLAGDSEHSIMMNRELRKTCNRLFEAFREGEIEEQGIKVLKDEALHPARRLAEAIVTLMGDDSQIKQFRKYLDSCMMIDAPNGIAAKRKATPKGKRTERRSLVLTNTVLDYLVHRHLRKGNHSMGEFDLPFEKFLTILRDRYGFWIDKAPPGISIPADLLRLNRLYLERRLRDLGLLFGVNDAESMKRLRPRFEMAEKEAYDDSTD